MLARCYKPKTHGYKNYGGKGISVCDHWRHSFKNFFADMGQKPSPLHTIDRYPNKNGNYEPGNCRWATPEQQRHNMNRTIWVEYKGEKVPLSTLKSLYSMKRGAFEARIKRGWDVERALSTPSLKNPRRLPHIKKDQSKPKGADNPNSKRIEGTHIETGEVRIFYGLKECGDYIGAPKSNVCVTLRYSGRCRKWMLRRI